MVRLRADLGKRCEVGSHARFCRDARSSPALCTAALQGERCGKRGARLPCVQLPFRVSGCGKRAWLVGSQEEIRLEAEQKKKRRLKRQRERSASDSGNEEDFDEPLPKLGIKSAIKRADADWTALMDIHNSPYAADPKCQAISDQAATFVAVRSAALAARPGHTTPAQLASFLLYCRSLGAIYAANRMLLPPSSDSPALNPLKYLFDGLAGMLVKEMVRIEVMRAAGGSGSFRDISDSFELHSSQTEIAALTLKIQRDLRREAANRTQSSSPPYKRPRFSPHPNQPQHPQPFRPPTSQNSGPRIRQLPGVPGFTGCHRCGGSHLARDCALPATSSSSAAGPP